MEFLQTFLIVLSSVKGSWYHLKRLGVAWEVDMIHARAWDRSPNPFPKRDCGGAF